MVQAYFKDSTTFRAKDLHLVQTFSSIVIVIPVVRAYLNSSTTFRAKDLHLFQTLSSIVIVIPVMRVYLSNPVWTQLHLQPPLVSDIVKYCYFLIRVYLSNQGYLKDSTTFRAKDLHLFQTLPSIIISSLWYLSVIQVVKAAYPGSESESY